MKLFISAILALMTMSWQMMAAPASTTATWLSVLTTTESPLPSSNTVSRTPASATTSTRTPALTTTAPRIPASTAVSLTSVSATNATRLPYPAATAMQEQSGNLMTASPVQPHRRPIVECTPRNGLPNFFDKIESGRKEMTLVYFGGSITDQPGYRVQSCQFLQSLYPDVHFTAINSSIGGTGSDLGALRCAHDVISHKPDLVFVEFAVNDGGADGSYIRRRMEGIVRQIWKADPHTDIVFVYTMTINHLKDLSDGYMFASSAADEDVADHYGIPSINMGVEVIRMLDKGLMTIKPQGGKLTAVSGETLDKDAAGTETMVFSDDGVHPYPNTGHMIYTGAIKRSWPSLDRHIGAMEHVLPEPMMPDCIENVAVLSCDSPALHTYGDVLKYEGGRPEFDNKTHLTELFQFKPGSGFSFKFKGSEVILYDILGPEGVILEVCLDDEPVKELVRFDGYCVYHRLSNCSIIRVADTDALHTVSVRVSGKDFDKRSRILNYMVGSYDSNPELFAPKNYYLGKIFIVGECVAGGE